METYVKEEKRRDTISIITKGEGQYSKPTRQINQHKHVQTR